MTMQGKGFLRPHMTGALNPEQDALLADVCPGSHVHLPVGGQLEGAAPEWGPLLSAATGYSTDPELRQQASSGGALSAVLKSLLASGQAKFILQVAASETVPWLNQVTHSNDAAQIRHASGSRYAPSAPLAGIVQLLDAEVPFAVVGKPCDIAALRAYARHDPRVDQWVVAMLAFMCGGVPSETGVKQLIRQMGAKPGEVEAFRYRGNGWPGKATATTVSGAAVSMSYGDSWGNVLSKHVQPRCKICADGTGMSADVVFADAWYGDEAGYPTFDEQDGRSLVLGRTRKGEALIKAAISGGYLATTALDPKDIEAMQPYQLRRTRLALSRIAAMRVAGRHATRFTGLALWRFSRRAGAKANIKSFFGTMLRAVSGRL